MAVKRHRAICPTHPGKIICEGLPELGVSKSEFARMLGVSRVTLHSLLAQRQGVSSVETNQL